MFNLSTFLNFLLSIFQIFFKEVGEEQVKNLIVFYEDFKYHCQILTSKKFSFLKSETMCAPDLPISTLNAHLHRPYNRFISCYGKYLSLPREFKTGHTSRFEIIQNMNLYLYALTQLLAKIEIYGNSIDHNIFAQKKIKEFTYLKSMFEANVEYKKAAIFKF